MTRVTLIFALLLGAAGCQTAGAGSNEAAPSAEKSAPEASAVRVEVATLQNSSATASLDLPGEFEGWEDATLAAANGGFVERVFVKEGQSVKKGDALVQVDRAPRYAQYKQAQAQLTQAQDDLNRAKTLADLAVEAQVVKLETQVQVMEANLALAQNQLDRATVRAPFDGVVGAIAVSKGEVTGPGAPVLRLVQLDPIKVVLSVSDRDVVALKPGLPARVTTAARGAIVTGEIAHVSPVADLSTRAFLVDVKLDNADRSLLPGMIARVLVDREISDDVVVIPQDWLVTKLDGYGVFVESEGVARWRPVVLGDVVSGQVIVQDGLTAGERVVVMGQHDLIEGDELIVAREGVCCESGRVRF